MLVTEEVCEECCALGVRIGSWEKERQPSGFDGYKGSGRAMRGYGDAWVLRLVPFLGYPPGPHVLTSSSRMSFRDQLYSALVFSLPVRTSAPSPR